MIAKGGFTAVMEVFGLTGSSREGRQRGDGIVTGIVLRGQLNNW